MKISLLIFIFLLSGCSLSNDLVDAWNPNSGKCLEVTYFHELPNGVHDYDRFLTLECKYMPYKHKHHGSLDVKGSAYDCIVVAKGRGGKGKGCIGKEKVSDMPQWGAYSIYIRDGTGGTFILIGTGNEGWMYISPNVLPTKWIDKIAVKEVSN